MSHSDTVTPLKSVGKDVNWMDLRSSLLRFIRSRRVAGESAEDITSETLHVVLQRYRPDYNTGVEQSEAIRRFAFGVAANQLKHWWRTTSRHAHLFLSVKEYEEVEDLMEEVADAPDEAYCLKEVDRRIREEIDTLPEKYRQPFYFRHYKERSISEIAELLNLSASAVKVRLHRARLMLKEQLRDLIK